MTAPSDAPRAWSLPRPLGPGGDGFSTPAAPDVVARRILEVVPGERPLLPELGWRAHLLADLDAPASRVLAAVLAERALRAWAPALGVDRVEVVAVGAATIEVDVVARAPVGRLTIRRRAAAAPASGGAP